MCEENFGIFLTAAWNTRYTAAVCLQWFYGNALFFRKLQAKTSLPLSKGNVADCDLIDTIKKVERVCFVVDWKHKSSFSPAGRADWVYFYLLWQCENKWPVISRNLLNSADRFRYDISNATVLGENKSRTYPLRQKKIKNLPQESINEL